MAYPGPYQGIVPTAVQRSDGTRAASVMTRTTASRYSVTMRSTGQSWRIAAWSSLKVAVSAVISPDTPASLDEPREDVREPDLEHPEVTDQILGRPDAERDRRPVAGLQSVDQPVDVALAVPEDVDRIYDGTAMPGPVERSSTQARTTRSSTGNGISPVPSTVSWKPLISNAPPSVVSASRRIRWISSRPIM